MTMRPIEQNLARRFQEKHFLVQFFQIVLMFAIQATLAN